MSSITEHTRPAYDRTMTEVESSNAEGGFFSFEGRIGRLEYFWIVLSTTVLVNALFLWASASDAKALSLWVAVPAILLFAYVGIAAGVKRCHDLNKSGWLYGLVAVPLVNVILGLYLLFAAGTGRSNQYGSSPSSATDSAHDSSMPMQPPVEMTGKHLATDISPHATIAALPEVASQPSRRLIKASDSERTSVATGTSDVPAEEFWASAILEVEGPNRRPGLWARVFSEARGDERIAKADYLRERAMELQNDFDKMHTRPEVVAKAETQEIDARVTPEALSQGDITAVDCAQSVCPNCNAKLLMTSGVLSKCTACLENNSGLNVAAATGVRSGDPYVFIDMAMLVIGVFLAILAVAFIASRL